MAALPYSGSMQSEGETQVTQQRGLNAAFGGVRTTLAEQREICSKPCTRMQSGRSDIRNADLRRRSPRVRKVHGVAARSVPLFSTQLIAAYPTTDRIPVIIESTGGGETIFGGVYEQRTSRKSRPATAGVSDAGILQSVSDLQGFGRDRWDARINAIMKDHNAAWPASQPPDPARLRRHLNQLII